MKGLESRYWVGRQGEDGDQTMPDSEEGLTGDEATALRVKLIESGYDAKNVVLIGVFEAPDETVS